MSKTSISCWMTLCVSALRGLRWRRDRPTARPSSGILLGCQFNDPVRVIVFNTEQGTSRHASTVSRRLD